MIRPKVAWFAVAASFLVYLIPLVGPHGAWLLGHALFEREPSPLWTGANWAIALILQFVAIAYFYWFFARPGWRKGILFLIALPLVFLSVQWAYLFAIPIRFLEQPDVAPEKISWPSQCTTSEVYLTNLSTSSELWVRYSADSNRYAVLMMPDCRVSAVNLPQPKFTPGTGVDFTIELTSPIFGGRAIMQKYDNKQAKPSWWLIPGTVAKSDPSPLPLEPPVVDPGNHGPPVLSTDGKWVAWLVTGSGPPVLNSVLLRPHDPKEKEKTVDLSSLGQATYSLENVDMTAEEVILWKTDRLISVDFLGNLKREYPLPTVARPQQTTYRATGNYWLAWDAYRENEPYVMEWSLASGAGTHQALLGRVIHSAAFDAAGKWIAVSVGTSLNIGKTQDAVYVLSASDGHEVFRKYLPPYSRSPVAFLEPHFFAYSDQSGVHLFRTPDYASTEK